MLLEHRRFTDADAVVVYVTGHGITAQTTIIDRPASHRPPEPLQGTPYRRSHHVAGEDHRGLNQVMIIIDVCQAGQLDDNLRAKLKRDLPPGWLVVVTAPAGVDAKLGVSPAR